MDLKRLWNNVGNGMDGFVGGNRELVQPVAPPLPSIGQPIQNQYTAPQQPTHPDGDGGFFNNFFGKKNAPSSQNYDQNQQQYQQSQGNVAPNGYDEFGNFVGIQAQQPQQMQQPQQWFDNSQQNNHPLYQQFLNNGGGSQSMGAVPPVVSSPIHKPEVKIDDSTIVFHAKMQMVMFKTKVNLVDVIPKSGFRKYLTRKEDAKVLSDYRKNFKGKENEPVDEDIEKALEREKMLKALEASDSDLPVQEALDFLQTIIENELREQQKNGTLVLPKSTDYQKDLLTLMMAKYAEVGLYVAQDVTKNFSERFGGTIGKTFEKIGISG